jgi:hypothetical protein
MSITPIQPSATQQILQSLPPGLNPANLKNLGATPLMLAKLKHPLLQKHAGLATDVKLLMELKQKLHGSRRKRGPRRSRRARRLRMQRRFHQLARQLMGRLQRLMNQHRNHRCGQAQSVQNGADFSFLNDPNLSMSEKIELFLQKIIQDSEAKIQELMNEQAGKGKSKKKLGSMLLNIGTKIGSVVAGVYGGPAAGMAVNAAGAAIGSAVGASSKGSSESDQRMTMFKIQKLQDHVQQMFQFFSTKAKKESDLIGNIIRNMA